MNWVFDSGYSLLKALARPTARALHNLDISANQVTLTRYLSPLLYCWWLPLYDSNVWVNWVFLAAILFFSYTDTVDGVMATELENKNPGDIGGVLDSFADKVFILSAYYYLTTKSPRFFNVFVGICIGEVLMFGLAAGWLVFKKQQDYSRIKANKWGKAKMTLEVAVGLLMTGFLFSGCRLFENLAVGLSFAVISLLIGSMYEKARIIFA